MSDVRYLSAWILAGFSGLSATLVTIFAPGSDAAIFPIGLFVLAVLCLIYAIDEAGDSDA